MSFDRSTSLFRIGDELIAAADQEKERSEEDIVTHLICFNARQSLANYLAGYLIRNNTDVIHPVSINGLVEQCKSINIRFASLDVSHFSCRAEFHDRNYCLGSDQVNECLRTAKFVRSFVEDEINNRSSNEISLATALRPGQDL
jgi:hypothetical protein